MSHRLRALDDGTHQFLGGPGLDLLAVVAAFALVIPGLGKTH